MNNFEEVRVLIADDYEINLQVLILSLKRMNLFAETAINGQLAFEMFKTNPHKIVLMDLMMPVMDGYEATKQIRIFEKENKLSPSIIIAISANPIDEQQTNIQSMGFDDILNKPFLISDLRYVLSKYITLNN